jgi:hypothetical protein
MRCKGNYLSQEFPQAIGDVCITYLGGGWYSNIGNAFIDLSALYLLKKVCPNSIIHFISDDPQSIFDKFMGSHKHSFSLISKIQSDYLVFSGECLTEKFIELNGHEILQLLKSNENCRVIIMGGGGHAYSKSEIFKVQKFLNKIKPYAFISRDSIAFEKYSDYCTYAHDGIDCAFFVSDLFTPPKLSIPEFIVINIDERPLGRIKSQIKNQRGMCIYTIHGVSGLNLPLLRKLIPARLLFSRFLNQPNTLISNNPFDYLTLYANCRATYSTRIHACIATLAFGNPAMLLKSTIRSKIFDKVGASSITSKLTYANKNTMLNEKEAFISFLKDVLS